MKHSADVVVIGGGIIGCATAAELAAAGADVVLVERREIAHGASGRNHGLLFYPQNEQTAPLYRRSHEMYRNLQASSEINIAFDEEPKGFIILVAEESQWAPAQLEAEACAAGGVPVEKLDAKDLYEAEPALAPGYLGGWLIVDGYRLDPAALTVALAHRARQIGAEVRTNEDVKQVLVRSGKTAGVVSDLGVISAPTVVDAAGPWAPKVARSAGTDLPITGARGW
ncbi:MAG: NAD(P)/FAD-dependent oxidoreductase, partial [Actinomycetota bacterium]